MMPPTPLESRLFRLCILLKLAFWVALAAILGRMIWAAATGGEQADPATLIAIVLGLGGLQLCAVIAWWRVRRARRRGPVA